MNNRIKEIRKTLDLSQEAFGERLGITGSGLSNIESRKRNVTEQMILSICREFNVNEEWLRTGNGDMFIESDNTNITAVATEFNLDTMSQTILKAYVSMDSPQRAAFNNFVREMSDRIMDESKETARLGINKIIMESLAPEAVKMDLAGKAASVFIEAFPYIGYGNIGEDGEQTANYPDLTKVQSEKSVNLFRAASSKSNAPPEIIKDDTGKVAVLKKIPKVTSADDL